ncbi:molybdenum cofactor synthesis 2 [Mycena leptocephala]|nr:molybdenum cofactor synthesis 2 [Mycena leptocephala]
MDSAASVAASLELTNAVCALSFSLDVQKIIESVGTMGRRNRSVHRDNSQLVQRWCTTMHSWVVDSTYVRADKVVTRLEYQAYSTLAIKTMANIIRDVQASVSLGDSVAAQPTIRCAVHHRLGVVPVGEPSIEAFVACERILEDVKAKVPIWKREYYEKRVMTQRNGKLTSRQRQC